MNTMLHAGINAGIIAVITAAIRFAPFIIFKNKTPKIIAYLGQVLPYAVMGMLVIYCLKDVSFLHAPYAIPEAAACLIVFILHKWKHNTLLSILSGTAAYMIMLHIVNGAGI